MGRDDIDMRAVIERLESWFKDKTGEHLFDLSMGKCKIPSTSANLSCLFLAHGVAMMYCLDERYAEALGRVKDSFKGMAAVAEHLGPGKSATYFLATICGSIADAAEAAAKHALKEER